MDNIALLILGIFISVIGIVNMTGNISTIHSYNRRKVKEEDVPKYGRAVGTGTLIIGVTTGIPRTYSTASLFICSEASWYFRIYDIDFSLVINICTMNPATNRRMDRPPNLQSKNRSMTSIVTAVTADPVISGSWCARKFSVCAVFSLMIFRSLPLLFWEKKPNESEARWCSI